MSHSLCLPNYSVGEDCYQKIGYYARHCGKKAAVIGGKTAMEKARGALLQGIDGISSGMAATAPMKTGRR